MRWGRGQGGYPANSEEGTEEEDAAAAGKRDGPIGGRGGEGVGSKETNSTRESNTATHTHTDAEGEDHKEQKKRRQLLHLSPNGTRHGKEVWEWGERAMAPLGMGKRAWRTSQSTGEVEARRGEGGAQGGQENENGERGNISMHPPSPSPRHVAPVAPSLFPMFFPCQRHGCSPRALSRDTRSYVRRLMVFTLSPSLSLVHSYGVKHRTPKRKETTQRRKRKNTRTRTLPHTRPRLYSTQGQNQKKK